MNIENVVYNLLNWILVFEWLVKEKVKKIDN